MNSGPDLRTEILAQLRRTGSDISKPHTIEFYLYFPTEMPARQAGKELSEHEYQVQVRPAATGAVWLCLASATLIPETAPLGEMGHLIDQLVSELGGEFDGWEAEVIKQ